MHIRKRTSFQQEECTQEVGAKGGAPTKKDLPQRRRKRWPTTPQWKQLAVICYLCFLASYALNAVKSRDNELIYMARDNAFKQLCNLDSTHVKMKNPQDIYDFMVHHLLQTVYNASSSIPTYQMVIVGQVRVSQIRSNSRTCQEPPWFVPSHHTCFEPTVVVGDTENISSFGGATGSEFTFSRSTSVFSCIYNVKSYQSLCRRKEVKIIIIRWIQIGQHLVLLCYYPRPD